MDQPFPYIVRGYHGTSASNAQGILSGGFHFASESGWLGPGMYFFEADSAQARRWAESHHKGVALSIIEASIDLSCDGLDLTCDDSRAQFRAIADFLATEFPELWKPDEAMFADVLVLNALSEEQEMNWVRALVLKGDREHAQATATSAAGQTEIDASTKTISVPAPARSRIVRNAGVQIVVLTDVPLLAFRVLQ